MEISEVLENRRREILGRAATSEELGRLTAAFGSDRLLARWSQVLHRYPLVGCLFSIDEEQDESGMGVDMYWLSPDCIIKEAFDLYPGKLVLRHGFIPVGACALGSGDQYFLCSDESCELVLVRILHEAVPPVDDHEFPEEGVERVSKLLTFLERSSIEAAGDRRD